MPFLFLRQWFISYLCEFCYLVDFLQLAPPSKDLVKGFGELVGSLHSAWTLFWFVARFLSPFFFFFYTYILLGISLVTYIRQGGLLLLSLFSFATYTHLRDLVMSMDLFVTYIRQGGILLLSLFLLWLTPI